MVFSETWSSSFCIVCNCFDDFRTNLPKNNGRSHRKENTNFPKWRWVRSKNVCWNSALLFSLAVTTKIVLRPSWDLSTWNNTCFLLWCRVTFRLHQFSKATFGTLALYILRLRCRVISNTYKNSFCFLRKTETFRNDVKYVPKNVFLSSARLDSLVVTKKAVLRACWDLSTWNNTCFLFKCRFTFWLRYFSTATFGTLALYILRLRCLVIPNTYKNSFWFFRKRDLRRFVLYAMVLMIFVQTFRKILGDFTERKTPTFQNDVEYVPKMSFWALLGLILSL